MNYLTGICSDRAAHLIADNRLVEAIAPLLAARRFGGGEGVEQNAAHLGWRLLESARADLLEERMSAAALRASFALLLAESPQGLFILANAVLNDDPGVAFGLAARMETQSPRAGADLRAAAVRLMTAAWSRRPASADAKGAILTHRLAACLADHPGHADLTELSAILAGRLPPAAQRSDGDSLAEADRAARHLAALCDLEDSDRTLEALGHFAAASLLAPTADPLPAHREKIGQRLLQRYFEAASEGPEAAVAALALLHAYAPQIGATEALLTALVAGEQWEAARQISEDLLERAPPTSPQWHVASRLATLAQLRLAGTEPEKAKSRAREKAIEGLTDALSNQPDLDELRNQRAELRLASSQFRLALEDWRFLAKRAIEGVALPATILHAVAHNLLILLPSGRRPETTWAAQELIREPLTGLNAQTPILRLLWETGATAEGRAIAVRIAETLLEYRLYADLEQFLTDLDRAPAAQFGRTQFGRAPSGRTKVYASLICWGSRYLEMLELTALASLASPGNLPALAQSADIVFELLVGPDDVAQVTAMPILRELAAYCEIRVIALPFPDGDASLANSLPYVVYGHGSHFTLLRARRDGADLLNLHPDIVYADGAIGALAPLTQGPPRVFFADGVNAAKTPVMAALEGCRRDGRLTVDARKLATLAAPHWMPRLTDCLYDTDAEAVIHYPHRLVFREADRVVMHSFCKTPLYVANQILRDIQTFNYATVDGYLLDSILDSIRRDQIFEVSEADPILIVELSDEDGVRYSKITTPLPQVITKMFYIFPFSARRYWLFETGVTYPPGAIGPVLNPQQRTQFLDGLRRTLAKAPEFVELDRERDQIRPAAVRGPALKA